MGKKSSSKKQNRSKKQQVQASSVSSAKETVAVNPGISLQQAIKAPSKNNGLHIESAQYVRKDIRLIGFLLAGMFVTLAVLTIVNNQTGFVAGVGQHLSAVLKFN